MKNVKYSLYRADITKENDEIASKYMFNYQDDKNIYIYTSKKGKDESFKIVDIERERLTKYILEWLMESNIEIAKKNIIEKKENSENMINIFLDEFSKNIKKIKERKEDDLNV